MMASLYFLILFLGLIYEALSLEFEGFGQGTSVTVWNSVTVWKQFLPLDVYWTSNSSDPSSLNIFLVNGAGFDSIQVGSNISTSQGNYTVSPVGEVACTGGPPSDQWSFQFFNSSVNITDSDVTVISVTPLATSPEIFLHSFFSPSGYGPPAATSTPFSSASFSSDHSGLSTGAKAGIGVAAALGGLAILGLALFFLLRRRRSKRRQQQLQQQLHDAAQAKLEDTDSEIFRTVYPDAKPVPLGSDFKPVEKEAGMSPAYDKDLESKGEVPNAPMELPSKRMSNEMNERGMEGVPHDPPTYDTATSSPTGRSG